MFSPHPNLFRPITELILHSSLDARSFPPSFTYSFLSLLTNLWGPLVNPISCLPWAIRTQGRVPARCAASSLLDKPSAPYDVPFSLCPCPYARVAPLPGVAPSCYCSRASPSSYCSAAAPIPASPSPPCVAPFLLPAAAHHPRATPAHPLEPTRLLRPMPPSRTPASPLLVRHHHSAVVPCTS
jgi:hypothetical protein